jgi:hypothetical protein
MLRSWLLPAVVAGLFIPSIVRADDPVAKTPQERMEASLKQLDEKLTRVLNEIATLDGKVRNLESKTASATDLVEMSGAIADLRRDVDKLRKDLVRSSAKPAPNGYQPMPNEANRLAGGTLRLINEFAFPQEVIVNGQSVPLDAGQSADISLPAGDFSFQVLSKDALPRTRKLAAGTVYTVRIR